LPTLAPNAAAAHLFVGLPAFLFFRRALSLPPRSRRHPEVASLALQPEGADSASFLILACDGVWDLLSSEDAVALVAEEVHALGGPRRASARDLEGVAERLKEAVLLRAADDDSVRLDALREMKLGKGGRRDVHDDITALVLFVGSDYARHASAVPGSAAPAAAASGASASSAASWPRLW
jgi:hypothetical protein